MGRPVDWAPLAAADPIPGDPATIISEAQHLKQMATQISDEVSALHQIAAGGADGALKGQYADQLHAAASDLAGKIVKVVGRFEKTAAALGGGGAAGLGWASELQTFQAKSLQLLSEAQSAQSKITTLNQQLSQQSAGSGSGTSGTSGASASAAQHTALKTAQGNLSDARQALATLERQRDDAANHYASMIVSACHDGMKDSWWDQFSDFVSSFAGYLKDVCTVLEIAGLILAVAAFIIAQFIPGLNFLVDALVAAAFWTTLAAMLGRGLLASTGNGSWADFALDALAVVTFGVGKFAAAGKFGGTGLKALASSAESAGNVTRSTELLANGKTAAYIFRYAALTGESPIAIADRFAPKLANVAVKGLSGGLKVLASAGCSPEEAAAAAKALAYGDRFGGLAGQYGKLAENAVKLAGGAAITGAGVGGAGLAGAGINFNSIPIHLNIPYVSNWYKGHVEIPTGDPEYA